MITNWVNNANKKMVWVAVDGSLMFLHKGFKSKFCFCVPSMVYVFVTVFWSCIQNYLTSAKAFSIIVGEHVQSLQESHTIQQVSEPCGSSLGPAPCLIQYRIGWTTFPVAFFSSKEWFTLETYFIILPFHEVSEILTFKPTMDQYVNINKFL